MILPKVDEEPSPPKCFAEEAEKGGPDGERIHEAHPRPPVSDVVGVWEESSGPSAIIISGSGLCIARFRTAMSCCTSSNFLEKLSQAFITLGSVPIIKACTWISSSDCVGGIDEESLKLKS